MATHTGMYSSFWQFWLLTCSSLELAGQQCALLCFSQAQIGHSPSMPAAPDSCQGNSATETWCRSCRCQKTRNLKTDESFCYQTEDLWTGVDPANDNNSLLNLFLQLWHQSLRSATEQHTLLRKEIGSPVEKELSVYIYIFILRWAVVIEEIFLVTQILRFQLCTSERSRGDCCKTAKETASPKM